MVGRELAGLDRVWLAMPAGAAPTVTSDSGRDVLLADLRQATLHAITSAGRVPKWLGAFTAIRVWAVLIGSRSDSVG
jgi:hypothetical protein